MRIAFLAALLMPLQCWSAGLAVQEAPPPVSSCADDTRAIFEYLKTNDAGVSSRLADDPRAFDLPVERSIAAAQRVTSEPECVSALRTFLKDIRRLHLGLETSQESYVEVAPPSVRYPSAQWAWLSLPSFESSQGNRIATLVASEKGALDRHSNWVIDVRGNAGGSDWTWQPLLKVLGGGKFIGYSSRYLSTSANIVASEEMKRLLGNDPASIEVVEQQIAAMKRVAPGSYGRFASEPDTRTIDGRMSDHVTPGRVFVVVDAGCASSCEQFLLTVRQLWNVKVIGANSAGSLDYSNLRPWTLPSGRGRLWYAISKSDRIPGVRIDTGGIVPDFPVAEIRAISDDGVLKLCRELLAPRRSSSRGAAGQGWLRR